jgi:hypothetical protein
VQVSDASRLMLVYQICMPSGGAARVPKVRRPLRSL